MSFIDTVVNVLLSMGSFLLGLAILARLAQLNPYNPLLLPLLRGLNALLGAARAFLPNFSRRLDLAEWLALLLLAAIRQLLDGFPLTAPATLGWVLLEAASSLINLMFLAILASVIKSWVAPGNQYPAGALIDGIADLLLAPIRRFIGTRTLDFSPMVAVVFLVLVEARLQLAQQSLELAALG